MARLAAWGAGAVLADDMGLGKTLQAIALLVRRSSEGPQLVVAPTSVGFNWRRELARFAPELVVRSYAGPDRARRLEEAGPGQVFVTSYGVVLRDAAELRAVRWATLVLDEAQAVKNPKTQRARALRGLDADWILALTGTPLENHPADLWALFRIVFPGLLGSFEAFRAGYLPEVEADPGAPRTRRGEAEAPTLASSALRRAIAPFVLRRTKAEVARELPPRTDVVVDVTLSERERALYDDARLAAIAEMEKADVTEETHHHPRVLAALTRLRQLACHPRLVDPRSRVPSSKLERFLQLATDLRAEGRRALVFSQFVRHIDLVAAALEETGARFARLDGRTPPEVRARRVDAFQEGALDLFLVSLKAGGTGLNLTAADTVVLLDPWWNPAVEDQAADRAHRIGQRQPVTVLRLIARGTVEEKMLDVHAEKRDLFARLLGGAAAPGRLTTEELVALIRGE
jgi:SNF2 family DNA or RNA helicase